MKKIFLVCFLVAGISFLSGADLIIAEKGRSDYQIVVPDSSGNARLDHFVELGGRVIRTAIRKAAGADVPLVKESQRIAGRPAIIIGNTAALKKAKLSSEKFVPWEYAVKVAGKDIFIYGKDFSAPLKNISLGRFLYHTSGSLKGCCTFAEKFLNTRFTVLKLNSDREYDGVRTLPLSPIKVPGSFALRKKPRFTTTGENGGMLFGVANNFLHDGGKRFDVHYIDKIIPAKKYAKSHPEYFALIDGKRLLREAAPQYCMSNPEVQKIVFEDALRRADIGYTVVELGQQDGFIGCQCEPCKKWYGTPDWGEKMWRFQRDLMEKLQKARPGVQVGIACYGVTHCVPKGYKKFPGKGAFINIAPARKDLLKKWEKFNLTGMNAWAYNMGPYLACGYSPPDSFKKLQKEIKFLRSTPVTSLYLCQYVTSYALNGPWIYAWGKFMGEPDADPKQLLMDYCRFTFGEKAAPGFFKFYSIIDRQMEKFPLENGQDFNDLEGRKKRQSALLLWQNRYPPQVLKTLERLFNENFKLCAQDNSMLKRLKVEFTYLKVSADVCNAIAQMNKNNTAANRRVLADALEKRNALPKSTFDTLIYTSDIYGYRWNTAWSHEDQIKEGVWYSRVTIPWAGCGRNLEEGMCLQMQIAFSTPRAKKLYAWHIPLSGSFADLQGFGGVRFGVRPKERVFDLNGNFAKLDSKGMPLLWKVGRAEMKLLPGSKGNMLQVTAAPGKIGSLGLGQRIFIEPDEELEMVFRLKGKGEISLGGQWRNNAVRWVENAGTPWTRLKKDFTEVRYSFSPGHRVQKGAAHFTPALHLRQGGTSVIVESVSARLKRKSAR